MVLSQEFFSEAVFKKKKNKSVPGVGEKNRQMSYSRINSNLQLINCATLKYFSCQFNRIYQGERKKTKTKPLG